MPRNPVIKLKPLPKTERRNSSLLENCSYFLMPQSKTYALGVEALRASYLQGECPEQPALLLPNRGSIVRPLTFRENLVARIEDYETLYDAERKERTEKDRLRLFGQWLDSCTAVGYKAKTTRFKIVPQSQQLITIPPEFQQHFLPISYDALEGVELDSSEDGIIYNNRLSKAQVLEHPAWLAGVEEDRQLLETYSNIFFALLKEKYKQDTGMAFYGRKNTEVDELRALFVVSLDNYSSAIGGNVLDGNGSFLRVVAQSLPRSGAPKK